jgi:hypothetical protein
MKAREFITKGIVRGDRVRVTMQGGAAVEGFFGGYKTFGGIEPDLSYIMPVFYAPTKSGAMGRRSAFGPDRCTHACWCDIRDVEKLPTETRNTARP